MRLRAYYKSLPRELVSIHAPRVGCDARPCRGRAVLAVSIHAPRVGCDTCCSAPVPAPRGFNSRTPCGVRHSLQPQAGTNTTVSIHAPRVGCDPNSFFGSIMFSSFQFTHPVWGATLSIASSRLSISSFQFTHPVWGATSSLVWMSLIWCFNSRTPCGVRHQTLYSVAL